jgi:AcrR family transcriptional regulator
MVTSIAGANAASANTTSRWTEREAEILGLTLGLLREHGYDRLTVDAVAAAARASKATVYRRWPSKAELVLAAVLEGTRHIATAPNTGSLRGDLLGMGAAIREETCRHASTIGALLPELSRSPALSEAVQDAIVHQRRASVMQVLRQAVDRREIDPSVISDEVWDILPGYLIFRYLVSGRPPTQRTIKALVDDVLLPSLIRKTGGISHPRRPVDSTTGSRSGDGTHRQ